MDTVIRFAIVGIAAGLQAQSGAGREEHEPPPGPSVPFYMYEPPSWNSGCDRYRVYGPCIYPDVAFHRQLESHPWRVTDRSKAVLFVVPAYISASLYGICGDHESNMRELEGMMDNSSSFRRSQGRDHLVSAFSWRARRLRALGAFEKHMSGMIVMHVERGFWPHTVVAPYANIGVTTREIKTRPLAERQRSLFFMGQADFRRSYKTRRLALHHLPPVFPQSVLVRIVEPHVSPRERRHHEDLPHCKVPGFVSGCTMGRSFANYTYMGGQSNYSLVIHGDTPSTSRLYDGLVFDQVPVIISDTWRSLAMPFAEALPWDDMAVFVSQEEFEQSTQNTTMSAVAAASDPRRLQSWRRARPALDWSLEGTCVATAVLLDAAREHIGSAGLPELLSWPDCAGELSRKGKLRRAEWQGTLNETLLEDMLMEERFD